MGKYAGGIVLSLAFISTIAFAAVNGNTSLSTTREVGSENVRPHNNAYALVWLVSKRGVVGKLVLLRSKQKSF